MPRTKKQSTEAAVREIRRRTRRKFSPEDPRGRPSRADANHSDRCDTLALNESASSQQERV